MWLSELVARLEQADVLDATVETVTDATNTVLPSGELKDALHGKWLGHPLHPLLVALPIGLWSGATLLDLFGDEAGRPAAQSLVGAGVLLVAPTAAAGLADWSELGSAKGAKRIGLLHAAANTVTALLYGASWLARRRGDHGRGTALAFAGLGGLSVGGFLGGHLAYSQGVGVNRNADMATAPRDWTDAAPAGDVPEGAVVGVEVEGQKLLLTRQDGELFAIAATCSHYGGPLDEGDIHDGCVHCPWHGSHFRLDDGSVARGPATIPQMAFDVRTQDDRLQVRVRR